MDLYIDRENLTSLIHSTDKDEFDDCIRMLNRQLHVIFNMERASLKDDQELLPWVNRIVQGRGRSEETDTYRSMKFPERPIKSNTCNNWDRRKLTSVYLISDIDSQKLKDRGCILIGDEGEEIEILSRLFCGIDYDYHHLYDLQKNFHSWNQLTDDNQMLPTADIVISDRYLFKNEYELVAYNLSGLLSALAYNVKNKINVVVYTLNEGVIDFGIEKATKIIQKTLEATTGMKPKITFVTSNDKSLIPHDRFVITNYRLLRSGDSFIYFNTNGERITNGGALDVDSLANHEKYIYVGSLIEKLQATYDKVKKNNSDMIIGREESNFIKMAKITHMHL